MAIEIERKFLVINDLWKAQVQSETRLQQGYFTEGKTRSIRVRTGNNKAFLNIKSKLDEQGMQRLEFEYEIPLADAQIMLNKVVLKPIIDKIRYKVLHTGMIWDLDVFAGDNQGLIMAEIELDDINQPFDLPAWAGVEVSDDHRYYNTNLISHPYKQW